MSPGIHFDRKRRWWQMALIVMALPWVMIMVINLWVLLSTRHRIVKDVAEVRHSEVALVLGTSKRRENGSPNLHFKARMEKAAALYHAGKVRHILVSGDNRSPYYNEPRDMQETLMSLGVPDESITCDYAGLRTLDSVVRAKAVFGLKRYVIVSDHWHVPRAVYIAQHYGLDTMGIGCEPVPFRAEWKSRTREIAARLKLMADLYFLKTQPTYLRQGDEINLDYHLSDQREH